MTVVQERRSRRMAAVTEVRRFITVTGVPGSGKSTVAINLAAELAALGKRVLLIDADTHAPALVTALGISQHPAGLSAACRAARNQTLTLHEIQRLCVSVAFAKHSFALLPGLANSERWPEVTPAVFQTIVELALATYDSVIVDAPSRFGAALQRQDAPLARDALYDWLVKSAERVLTVCAADPVSVANLVKLEPNGMVIVNKFRTDALGLNAKHQIETTLKQLVNLEVSAYLPLDLKACDQAVMIGGPLHSVRRKSPLRLAFTKLARDQILSG